jgi:molecular chaperone GrpE
VVAAADALSGDLPSEVTAVASGVRVVAEKAQRALEGLGVERIDVVGVPFDPTVHDAVQQIDGEQGAAGDSAGDTAGDAGGAPAGPTVHTVLRPGYRFTDRVLRPAMVVVAQ